MIDESPAENRAVPVQEAGIRWKKVSLVGRYVCCAERPLNSGSPLTVPVR